ncbi:MAG: acyltransferase [Rhodocyclaceae bacterium]
MKARLYGLDGLRGLAALAVVVFHYSVKYDQVYGEAARAGLPFAFVAGQYGVELFFMISGYVIFMTLDKTKHAADFLVSRFSRLYPAYWVALAATFAVLYAGALPDKRVGFGQLAANLSMVQSFMGVRHVDGVYWSLQIELVFYLWMLLFWATGLLRHVACIVVAWVCASALVHLRPELLGEWQTDAMRWLILRYVPHFAIGMAVFLWSARRLSTAASAGLVALSLLAVKPASDPYRFLVSVALAPVFWIAVSGQFRLFESRILVFLGAISYPLYLLHQNIGYAIIRGLIRSGWNGVAAAAFAIAVSIACAWLLHRLVEAPAMTAIRERYRRRRRRALAATP